MKIGNRVMMCMYLDPPQRAALKALAERTRVPMSVYFREAIDDLLLKHQEVKKRQLRTPAVALREHSRG